MKELNNSVTLAYLCTFKHQKDIFNNRNDSNINNTKQKSALFQTENKTVSKLPYRLFSNQEPFFAYAALKLNG